VNPGLAGVEWNGVAIGVDKAHGALPPGLVFLIAGEGAPDDLIGFAISKEKRRAFGVGQVNVNDGGGNGRVLSEDDDDVVED